MFFKNTMVGD